MPDVFLLTRPAAIARRRLNERQFAKTRMEFEPGTRVRFERQEKRKKKTVTTRPASFVRFPLSFSCFSPFRNF